MITVRNYGLRKVPVNEENIKRHPATPRDLQYRLTSNDDNFKINFRLYLESGSNYEFLRNIEGSIDIGEMSEKEALNKYKKVRTQIEKGNYKLHLYEDGRMEVELTN